MPDNRKQSKTQKSYYPWAGARGRRDTRSASPELEIPFLLPRTLEEATERIFMAQARAIEVQTRALRMVEKAYKETADLRRMSES